MFMRLLLLLLITTTTLFAEAQQITGSVKDEKGNPLNGATVSLVRAADTSTIKLAISKADGSYTFPGIKEGVYKVLATYVGYKTASYPGLLLSSSHVIVPELKLAKLAGTLSNVNVTASKPMVEVKADKTILNVEGTINAVGSNVLELLRKSPGVLLDKDDNISLAEKTACKFILMEELLLYQDKILPLPEEPAIFTSGSN
jgi:hypothetical protein